MTDGTKRFEYCVRYLESKYDPSVSEEEYQKNLNAYLDLQDSAKRRNMALNKSVAFPQDEPGDSVDLSESESDEDDDGDDDYDRSDPFLASDTDGDTSDEETS